MKKYLGGMMGAYCAIVLIIFVIIFSVFGIVILTPRIDAGGIIIASLSFSGVIMSILLMRKFAILFYSWGTFSEKGISIKSLFSRKPIEIEYEKCKSIGIGLYVHGVMNSDLGSKEKYIFFSYEGFEEKYRLNINQWQPSPTRIKVGFNKKLYDYLLTVLPKQQAKWLKNDYEKYVKPFSKR